MLKFRLVAPSGIGRDYSKQIQISDLSPTAADDVHVSCARVCGEKRYFRDACILLRVAVKICSRSSG